MTPDPRPAAPPLIQRELGQWKALLSGGGDLPDPATAPAADAAGLQFLAAVLCWAPGRATLDQRGDSPVAVLWRRLGLDDPADALPVIQGGRLTGFRDLGGAR